jgi:outer membrane immunogenic protein
MSCLRTRKTLIMLSLFLSCSLSRAVGQARNEIAVDYSYVRGDASNGAGLNLHGGDASVAFTVAGQLSLVGEAGVNQTANISGTGLDATISTFMAGPRVSPLPFGRFQPSFQVLLVAARASGSAFSAIGNPIGFAVAPGVRLDYLLSSRIYLRLLEADYHFSTYRQNVNDHEKSVRIGAGLVVRF